MNTTGIEWCDKTLNPVVGCTYGCQYCYARRQNNRFHWVEDFSKPQFFPMRLHDLDSKKPKNIFMCSMSDPADWTFYATATIFKAMKRNLQHSYLFLTKRPFIYDAWQTLDLSFPDLWAGVTVTSQCDTGKIAYLPLATNRFVSIEPLLGFIDLDARPSRTAIPWADWVIIGAETGPGAKANRPRPEWIEEIVSYCDQTHVPVFMKDSLLPIVEEAGMRRDFPQNLKRSR